MFLYSFKCFDDRVQKLDPFDFVYFEETNFIYHFKYMFLEWLVFEVYPFKTLSTDTYNSQGLFVCSLR